jgi:hypothetical protein
MAVRDKHYKKPPKKQEHLNKNLSKKSAQKRKTHV